MLDYDSELRLHHHALLRSLEIRPRDRVLDIGCGSGQTTRDAARLASEGRVFGIDIAEPALQLAQQTTIAAGLRNADYVCGDAASLPFPRASVDCAISRFGTMFFANPVAAFTRIRDTLSAQGRLVMMVWQAAKHNAWSVAIHRALVDDVTAVPEPSAGPSAFSLADEQTVRSILSAAAFVDVNLEDVHEPVYYGADVESAFQFVSQFANVMGVLQSQPHRERERTLSRLRDTMAAHLARDGVWFNSRAWIVTAGHG